MNIPVKVRLAAWLGASLYVLAPLASGASLMENLGRGVVAVRTSSNEVFVSWRILGTDPADVAFNLYRSTGGGPAVQLNGAPLTGPTHFTDTTADLTQANAYFVRAIMFGLEGDPSASYLLPPNVPVQQYLRVPLSRPPGGVTPTGESFTYSPNDTSVGDLDGDGEYELVIKWEPSNPRDSSQDGFTGNTLFDAYTLDGMHLWRIDLGVNVRAGPHDTPFIVYDFDGDGRAEVAIRTAPGTRDGLGNFVADPAKFSGPFPTEPFDHNTDYRNSSGRTLVGPEFLTIFDGLTGEELTSTKFLPARHPDTDFPTPQQLFDVWGDNFGNRANRFYPPGVAYLDGERPSIVWGRGYAKGQQGHPGRIALAAWNYRDGVITPVWTFDSRGHPLEDEITGQGAHSASVADLNGDGRDDIVYGQVWLLHDGTLHHTGWGHGDALHVSNMDPDRPGQQVFMPHESPAAYGPNALSYEDGATGNLIFGVSASGDIGRGVAADVDPRFRGFEMWGSGSTGGMYNVQLWVANAVLGPRGVEVSSAKPNAINHVVWWDGDLLRELLDSTTISKWNWMTESTDVLLSPSGIEQNNGTKANPCLQADILGDWREEVIWRESGNDAVRIYTTVIPTTHRFFTPMHDRQYREAIAFQNVGYNQPPHPSFYLGDGMAPVPPPDIVTSLDVLLGPPAPVFSGVVMDTGIASDDAVTSDTTLILTGTATPNTTVNVTRLGVGLIGSAPVNGAGNWSLDYTGTTLPEGETFFSATATDSEGRTGAPTNPPFRVVIDTTPPAAPTIADVADEEGALVITGTAEPGSAVAVLLAGTGEIGTAVANAMGEWTFVHDDMVGVGPQAFSAIATDLAGNSGPESGAVEVDTSIATPAIVAIIEDTGISATDGTTSDPTLVFEGTGPAGATISVKEFGLGVIGTTTADDSGNWSFDHTGTALADGIHLFSAAATVGGATSPSSPALIVTIDTVAPAVVSVNREAPSSQNTSAATVTFRVTFSENVQGVDAGDFTLVFSGGLSGTIASVTPSSDTTFDVTVNLVDEGTVRLDVNAAGTGITDTAGNGLAAGFTTGQTYNRLLTGDGVWIRNDSGGLWSDNANWENGIIGAGVNATADFATLELVDDLVTVHLDSPRTIGNLVFGDTDIATATSWVVNNNGNPDNILTLAVSSGAPTITVNPLGVGATTTLDVGLVGSSGLSKLGPGPLVLTQPTALTGPVNINGGILRLAEGATLSNGNNQINVNGGTQLHVMGGTLENDNLVTVVSSPLIIDGGTVALNDFRTNSDFDGTLRLNAGTLTVDDINIRRNSAGSPSFNSGVIIAGGTATANTIQLGSRNSNGAMSVEGGDITVLGAITIGNQDTSGRGGALRVIGGTLTSTDTTDGIIITRRATNVASATFSGGVSTVEKFIIGYDASVTSGSGTLTINGGTVFLGSGGILSGAGGTFSANVNLSGGVLGAKADWSTALNVNLPTGGNITLQAADAADEPHDITLGGVLSGNGGFTKTGGGRLTLSGASTFGGAVAIDGGVLDLTGSLGPGGDVAVNNGGMLTGTGTANRTVVLNSGGAIAPGGATLGSALTAAEVVWNADGALAFELDGSANQLTVTGALTKGGDGPHAFVFTAGPNIAAGDVYTLVTFGSTDFTADDFSFDTLAPGLSGAFSVTDTSIVFTVFGPPVVVTPPENVTVLMGGTATFTVVVGETPGLTYQWLKDGAPIAGATEASLTITNVLAADIGSYSVTVTNAAGSVTSPAATLAIADTSLVQHAPALNNADVTGSIQQMLGEFTSLNTGTTVLGSLFVPGTPNVVLNGTPNYGGTIDGEGAASPSNYLVMVNNNVTLEHVVRRTDPVPLPVVNAPDAPQGTRSVTLNNPSQQVGDWSTVRNLTLNNNVGPIAVPAGVYGNFTANGGGFILGEAGATQPSVYHFQRLTLNNAAQVQVVGPVIVVLGNTLQVNGGVVGNEEQPAWLTLNIASGGLSLNSGGDVFGYVAAPSGTIMVNGNGIINGVVAADRLTVNSNGTLLMPAP